MKDVSWSTLISLDESGNFPREGESAADFVARVDALKGYGAPDELRFAAPIPPEIIAEGGNLTEKLFAFRRTGDLGFFESRGIGLLGGGCTLTDPDSGASFFLLRKGFARKKKWFCYRRDELLAHELCHVARAPLGDLTLEEYFAYRTSFSALRRALGDIFTTSLDALLFLAPAFLLPVAAFVKVRWIPRLEMGVFYALFGAVMLFFAIRSIARRRLVRRAQKKLTEFGVGKPLAVLFRMTAKECNVVAGLPDGAAWQRFLAQSRQSSLRWEIIARRFCA